MKSNVFSSPINGLSRGIGHEIVAVLERLLQRNPTHPVALELVRQFRP